MARPPARPQLGPGARHPCHHRPARGARLAERIRQLRAAHLQSGVGAEPRERLADAGRAEFHSKEHRRDGGRDRAAERACGIRRRRL